jgi:uncharacterized protein (TIGR03083 family)
VNLDHAGEIVVQTERLCGHLVGADLSAPVPSCPGWNLVQLLRHVGAGHRWAEKIVRTRATEPPPDTELRRLNPDADVDVATLAAWLAQGAAALADALRAAGPETPVWAPLAGVPGRVAFYARRFAHETLIHRADAALALGATFIVEPAVAVDAMDEWLDLGSLPEMFEFHPRLRELLGAGRTIHLHATDTGFGAEWVVDLTGERIVWRRAHEKCAVAVRGPLTELLLLIYRRRPPGPGVEMLGDLELLRFWLDRVAFG